MLKYGIVHDYSKYIEHYILRSYRHDTLEWYDRLIPTVCQDGTIAKDLYVEFNSVGLFRHAQHMAQLANYSASNSDL